MVINYLLTGMFLQAKPLPATSPFLGNKAFRGYLHLFTILVPYFGVYYLNVVFVASFLSSLSPGSDREFESPRLHSRPRKLDLDRYPIGMVRKKPWVGV